MGKFLILCQTPPVPHRTTLKQLGIGCVHNTIGGRERLPIQHERLPRAAAESVQCTQGGLFVAVVGCQQGPLRKRGAGGSHRDGPKLVA